MNWQVTFKFSQVDHRAEENPGETNDCDLASVNEKLLIDEAKQENIEEPASVLNKKIAASKLDDPEVEETEDGTSDD